MKTAYRLLASSMQWRVRRTLAFSLHEIAKILGQETAEMHLLPIFEGLLGDTDEVSIGVVSNLASFMSELSPSARLPHLHLLPEIGAVDGDDMIGNWRLRAALSEQLSALSRILPASINEQYLLPLLLSLLKDPASAVRLKSIEAVGVVLQNTRGESKGGGSSSAGWRAGRLGGVLAEIKLMATNPRWLDRQAYAQICGAFVGVVDREVVTEELLPLMLMMVDDSVPNVRCELAKALAVFQKDPAYAGLADLRDAVGTLRNDPDTEVCKISKRFCTFDSEQHFAREFTSTGLQLPLK